MDTIRQSISRGDIYYADLNPVVGCEQGGIRPVLILQNDIGNRHSPTTIVCAITGKPKKPLPTHTAIAGAGRLSRESFALLEQIRTIDRARLREWVGRMGGQSTDFFLSTRNCSQRRKFTGFYNPFLYTVTPAPCCRSPPFLTF